METIRSLLDAKTFEIPENQRGYSWTSTQINELLRDLELAHPQNHYAGAIIVSRKGTVLSGNRPFDKYVVEDGQQRLVTFVLMLNELRQRLAAIHGPDHAKVAFLTERVFLTLNDDRLRITNRNSQLHDYLSHVLKGVPASPAELTAPMVRMRDAAAHIRTEFHDHSEEMLEDMSTRLLDIPMVMMVDLTAGGSINRFLAFDAINSRGLPLSVFDKIKNFCLLLKDKRGMALDAQEYWYKSLVQLERFQVSSRSNENDFISELSSVYHGHRWTPSATYDAIVDTYEKLLSSDNAVLEDKLSNFIQYWPRYAASYGLITCNDITRKTHNTGEVLCSLKTEDALRKIHNMGYLGIARRILASAKFTGVSKTDLNRLVEACEKMLFRIYGIKNYRTDYLSSEINRMSGQLLHERASIEDSVTEIAEYLSDSCSIESMLRFLTNDEPKYSYAKGYKGWDHCYYFLYEYEIHHSAPGIPVCEWASGKEAKLSTQEHILPQTHRDGGWWEKHWPDEAEANAFMHRLGNLVLTRSNSSLGRKEIEKKIEDSGAVHYYRHSQSTSTERKIPEFTDGATWRQPEILRRELTMVQWARERWALPQEAIEAYSLPDIYQEHLNTTVLTADRYC